MRTTDDEPTLGLGEFLQVSISTELYMGRYLRINTVYADRRKGRKVRATKFFSRI